MEYLLGKDEQDNEIKINIPNSNLFICGAAGTGKTHLIHKIIENLKNELEENRLKLCIIDTKYVEYYEYKKSEHLYLPNASSIGNIRKAIRKLHEIILQKQVQNDFKILFIIEDFSDFYYAIGKRLFKIFLTILSQGKEYGIYSIVSTQTPVLPFPYKDLLHYFDNIICFTLLFDEESINIFGSLEAKFIEYQKEALIKNINGTIKVKLIDFE